MLNETPAVLRLNLNIRDKHLLTIDVNIKDNSVDVVYVDSENLNYEKLSDGQELIHPKYNDWVKILLRTARAAAKK
ncbi:MAG: hypothetical protein LBQ81_03185 [Zoogloeaceae bacterium]|nr:hypothetical protein [Zoogloeaceae bacterium]